MRCILVRIVVALLIPVLVAGCASSPQAVFYTLSAQPSFAPAGSTDPKAIVVNTVSVPEIVDRPQFVIRVNANEVTVDEFARWADSLKSQIRRVVIADLALEFPRSFVSSYAGAGDPADAYQVSVDVQSFESSTGEAAVIAVLWTVRPPHGSPIGGRSVVHEPTAAQGYDGLVAAHSRALASVSHDIATAIRSRL